MRAFGPWFCLVTSLFLAGSANASALDRIERPHASWRGTVFEPNFRFPARARPGTRPWEALSFRKEPKRYLRILLDYALQGQDRVHWQLRANRVRGWYHVPWLGPGPNGREFIHGLTRARDFAPGELGPRQTSCRQNWALAFYNEAGGAVLGRVWRHVAKEHGGPELGALPFPVGTVAVKLVFTEATPDDDARLDGAPAIASNIHLDTAPSDTECASALDSGGKPAARRPKTVRLIQFDIAVREDRASYKTAWVFGSFVYDGTLPGADPWTKLVPLGLMWGNDPQLSDAAAGQGAKPRQSIVVGGHQFGRGGRMNGLVDEHSSSCSSCHMAAQWPSVARMAAPAQWEDGKCWFRNLDARYPFGFEPGSKQGCSNAIALGKTQSLDFSLQLAIGLRNWSMAHTKAGRSTRSSLGNLERRGDVLEVNGEVALPLRR